MVMDLEQAMGHSQTVLVTGTSGFIGRHLYRYLRARGFAVRTVGRRPARESESFGDDHVIADIREDFSAAAQGCSCVVHLAGRADASASYEAPYEFAETTLIGTLRALEAARRHGTAFVLASSQRVYRPATWPLTEESPIQPVDPYGEAKRQAEAWAELYARLYGVRSTVLRLFSVYGPGQVPGKASGVVSIFLQTARRQDPLRVRARQLRDFIDVRDVCRAFELAIERPPDGFRICNVGTGQATSIAELAEMVRNLVGLPIPLVLDVTPGAESYIADPRRAVEQLEFEAEISLSDGLEWCYQHLEDDRPAPDWRS